MTADITLVRAPRDEEFRVIHYSGLPWTGLLLVSIPVGIAMRRRFWSG